jgi:cytochrome c oxidase subunit II
MTASYAAIATLLASLAVLAIALAISGNRFPTEAFSAATTRLYKARKIYFIVLFGAVLVGLALTLPTNPYPYRFGGNNPDLIVKVGGQMWSWSLTADAGGRSQEGGLVLPAGKLIEFDVSATDVNHNFGIYDSAGTLIAQVQAMPGYTNRLFHTFDLPGRYYVLCLEYCGIAHHLMNNEFEVR